jgi:UDP-glucose 4-epimerase
VLETIRAAEEVTGKTVPYVIGPRRDGDPPALVASPDRIRERLGWSPRYGDLRVIIGHAWKFERARAMR